MAEDVIAQAQSVLAKSPIHALRDVQVQRQGDSLILSGCVDSFYHKQLAQELVRMIAADIQVINDLDVKY